MPFPPQSGGVTRSEWVILKGRDEGRRSYPDVVKRERGGQVTSYRFHISAKEFNGGETMHRVKWKKILRGVEKNSLDSGDDR